LHLLVVDDRFFFVWFFWFFWFFGVWLFLLFLLLENCEEVRFLAVFPFMKGEEKQERQEGAKEISNNYSSSSFSQNA